MTEPYTPSVAEARAEYVTNRALRVPTTVSPAEEFDRMIEAVRAEEREKAARLAESSLDAPKVTGEARHYIAARIREQGA